MFFKFLFIYTGLKCFIPLFCVSMLTNKNDNANTLVVHHCPPCIDTPLASSSMLHTVAVKDGSLRGV